MKSINSPTLILDKERILNNIGKMHRKAELSAVTFRPHFKTHQSIEIGKWFRQLGVEKITVSSANMARYFAQDGWSDITIAFLINPREIGDINELNSQVRLNLVLDSLEAVKFLSENLTQRVDIWIKTDAGYGRTGALWDCDVEFVGLFKAVHNESKMKFRGLLTHNGETYGAQSKDEILRLHTQSVKRLLYVKNLLLRNGAEEVAISMGDTPSCSLAENFQGIDEMRPGNFVFYDAMQYRLGTCGENDIAAAVACPVVGKYADRRQLVLYGGGVHLSKEYIPADGAGRIYGYVMTPDNGSFGKIDMRSPIISLTQEHGIVQADGIDLKKIHIGDLAYIVPVHSCLTANLYKKYMTLDGEIINRL